jgi:hypothetical protein
LSIFFPRIAKEVPCFEQWQRNGPREHHPHPSKHHPLTFLTLIPVAEVYHGIVIGISMYGRQGIGWAQDMSRTVQRLTDAGRTNLAYLNGRQYISTVGEGATQAATTGVNACENGARGQNYHRCTGPYGSIIDVTLWDLVEVFHHFLQV